MKQENIEILRGMIERKEEELAAEQGVKNSADEQSADQAGKIAILYGELDALKEGLDIISNIK